MMFDIKLCDMIYVDVERTQSNVNRTVITYFDLGNGKTKREVVSGGTFDNNGDRLARTIFYLAPVQVIFDEAGLGIAMKNFTLKALSNYSVDISESGLVSLK
jgi:hypothetical protein